jgi:hypothetical protein
MNQQLLMDLGCGYKELARGIFLGLMLKAIWYFLCKSKESRKNDRN